MDQFFFLCIGCALLTYSLAHLYRLIANALQIVDTPNHRSAHQGLVPTGAGVSFVLVFWAAFFLVSDQEVLTDSSIVVYRLIPALVVVATIGFIDDYHALSWKFRFTVHVLCCCYIVWVTGLPGLNFLGVHVDLGFVGMAIAVLGLIWLLNLYNFMDGIDGIASLQAIFVCLAGALLGSLWGADWALVQMCLVLGAACLGFLVFNWPQASLFLGDAGSVPLGFLLAAMSLAFASSGGIEWLTCWLILLGVFIVDASTTLCWRILKGQPFLQAHNLHGYQRLSRHWKSHTRVLVLLMAINLFWLLPLAYLAMLSPEYSVIWLICAYFPLVAGVLKTYKLP